MTKLLSKCVEHQILKQVEDGSVCLSDSQGGFRAERSRYDLILLLRCAQEHYHPQGRATPPPGRTDRKLYAAFLDIKKAYDSVPHSKIVERLREAGVREELVRVVADLLWNRTTVIYGNTINIGRGVPQGDPLSPLLFILMLQPLSDALATLPCGGASLPGGLTLKDLLYADDIALLAESPEDLNAMLHVCEQWATESGFIFSVEKSKVMVLAGRNPQQMPIVDMYGEALEWVKVFQYLGFPIYANNKRPKYLPLDLTSVFQVVGPMASVLRPEFTPRPASDPAGPSLLHHGRRQGPSQCSSRRHGCEEGGQLCQQGTQAGVQGSLTPPTYGVTLASSPLSLSCTGTPCTTSGTCVAVPGSASTYPPSPTSSPSSASLR